MANLRKLFAMTHFGIYVVKYIDAPIAATLAAILGARSQGARAALPDFPAPLSRQCPVRQKPAP
jgi:hypothetical protein